MVIDLLETVDLNLVNIIAGLRHGIRQGGLVGLSGLVIFGASRLMLVWIVWVLGILGFHVVRVQC